MSELLKKWSESSFIRHVVLLLLTATAIIWLSNTDTKFTFAAEILGTAVLAVFANIYVSSIAVYAYTKINFIKGANSEAISKIYLGNAILIGLVFTGAYFVKFL